MKPEELKELIRFCREQNVSQLKVGTVEIRFTQVFEMPKAPHPEDVAKQNAQEYANLMFMSSN